MKNRRGDAGTRGHGDAEGKGKSARDADRVWHIDISPKGDKI